METKQVPVLLTEIDSGNGQILQGGKVIAYASALYADRAAEMVYAVNNYADAIRALKESVDALEAVTDAITAGERFSNAGQMALDALNSARALLAANPL